MPRGRGRGGYRAPSSPAGASGPGALSQRTDSGATQPVRAARQALHGQRGEIEAAQQAQPLPQGGPTLGGRPVEMGAAPPPNLGVFDAPGPPDATPMGLGGDTMLFPPDPSEALVALSLVEPSPELARLLSIEGWDA